MNSEKLRLFLCIDFPHEVNLELTRLQQQIKKAKFHGKLTEDMNLHLTLKFLGEVEKEKVPKIIENLEKIKHQKLKLKLSNIGIFEFHKNPRIVWIDMEGKSLFQLKTKIDSALLEFFPVDEYFVSHCTLARIKYVKSKPDFREYIKSIKPKKIEFEINSFKLKSSKLEKLGPEYETIKEILLGPL